MGRKKNQIKTKHGAITLLDATSHAGLQIRVGICISQPKHMSRDMRFPTMLYVRPAKPQISLRIRTV